MIPCGGKCCITLNKIKILRHEITMKKSGVVKGLIRKEGRGVAFTTLTYLEDSDWAMPFTVAKFYGYPYCYAVHDKDSADKVHCQSIIRVPHPQTISAFAKKFHIAERKVQILSSWRDYCLYLIHADFDSKIMGKYQYSDEILCGNFKDEVQKVIRYHKEDNFGKSKEDDQSILQIIDFIESCEYISTKEVIRWCCLNGLYSNLRRSAGLIQSVIKEHNNLSAPVIRDTTYNIRMTMLEEKLEELEKKERGRVLVEKASGMSTGTLVNMDAIRELLNGKNNT